MLVEERRRAIVELVAADGRVMVEDLARRFDTSAVTIRSDLAALAGAGNITRSHGGALPARVTRVDTPLTIKEIQHPPEKRRIAAAAARLINDHETIILDSGSTTAEVARQIHERTWQSLTVITNAINIALELKGVTGVRVMMLGGMLRPTSSSLVGPEAEQALSKLSADRLFLGVDGLDLQAGITTPEPSEAILNALMIRASRETVAVMDASKFGRRSLSVIAPLESLHVLITDTSAPHDMIEALIERGVRVMQV